jgi:stress-induced morphogen
MENTYLIYTRRYTDINTITVSRSYSATEVCSGKGTHIDIHVYDDASQNSTPLHQHKLIYSKCSVNPVANPWKIIR